MTETAYHNPVLLEESVNGLDIKKNGIYVDATFGGGGHSIEILNRLGPKGKLIAFDQDRDVLKNIVEDSRFLFLNENFKNIKRFLKFYGFKLVDGIIADFGVSSHQINSSGRGFSFRFDGPLDMRMNQDKNVSSKDIVNNYDEEKLKELLKAYGELRQASLFARAIVRARTSNPILTTLQLSSILKEHIPVRKRNKILAQIFQALRIEVNDELESIKSFLMDASDLIKHKGRLSVISYHSLEDRLVKRFIRDGIFYGKPQSDVFGNYNVPFKRIGKLVLPSRKEIIKNNRARSARLRIAEKI
tara:strand:- start:129662 stop:130567 length:906 start_codon:yes stop_codon:yes gene_type:complete